MSVYEFVCNKCSCKFEKLLSMNNSNGGVTCPKCSGEAHKVFSTFATISKGSYDMDSHSHSEGGGCSSCSTPTSCSTCGG